MDLPAEPFSTHIYLQTLRVLKIKVEQALIYVCPRLSRSVTYRAQVVPKLSPSCPQVVPKCEMNRSSRLESGEARSVLGLAPDAGLGMLLWKNTRVDTWWHMYRHERHIVTHVCFDSLSALGVLEVYISIFLNLVTHLCCCSLQTLGPLLGSTLPCLPLCSGLALSQMLCFWPSFLAIWNLQFIAILSKEGEPFRRHRCPI